MSRFSRSRRGAPIQSLEIIEFEANRKTGLGKLEFRIPELRKNTVFSAKIGYNQFGGWVPTEIRDVYGDWVDMKVFAKDMDFYRFSDSGYLLTTIGIIGW